MIQIHKTFFIPIALVSALALAAVVGMACGSDDGGTAGDGGDQLTIGSLIPFTGSLSYFGEPMSNAFNLAITHVNDAGGVNGANVATQHRDTAVSPVQGVDSARALVDVDGASAIVGALSSGVNHRRSRVGHGAQWNTTDQRGVHIASYHSAGGQ